MSGLAPAPGAVEPKRPQRMHLSALDQVRRMADERAALQRKLDLLRVVRNGENRAAGLHPKPLRVELGGEALDDEFVALVLPVIERELQAQLHQLEREIEAYGVEIN